MKNQKSLLIWTICLCLLYYSPFLQAQEVNKSDSFYATMLATDAKALQELYPDQIAIYFTEEEISAVQLTQNAAHHLHHKVLTHGPGYVYMPSLEEAVQSIKEAKLKKQNTQNRQLAISYTIDQDSYVNQALNLVNNLKIESTIQKLVSYGTRYHTYSSATQSVNDMKATWESMAAGRSDISVRLVHHSSTNMPSVVMTIRGTTYPDEYVIIGGHIDSTNPRNNALAPGADDDASGIATITEAARVLIAMNFKPQRTIEFMAYAAEEVGLRGSREIAEDYRNRNVKVLGYTQFDMTNYKGSAKDIYLINDQYTTPVLNNFLMQLLNHYNASGTHTITYSTTQCNYGCSDHASWEAVGYNASFPVEATLRESNPYIHTAQDTYDRSPVPQSMHATKFAKLALEFLIEVAKADTGSGEVCDAPSALSAADISSNSVTLSWTQIPKASGGYQLRYRNTGATWITTNSSSNIKLLTGLSPNTTYEFQVKSICTSQQSSFSAITTFKTKENNPTNYCNAAGNSARYEWIKSVKIGTFMNESQGNGGYGDYTSKSVPLNMGGQYNISLSPGFLSSSYREYWRIWIDYNRDGDFSDPNEKVFDTGSSSYSTVTGSFNVPTTLSPGTTRMRVIMRYKDAPEACGTFDYGEVEDYTVNIVNSTVQTISSPTKVKEASGFVIYPNPADTDIITLITREEFVGKGVVKIMTLEGKLIKSVKISEPKMTLNINELPSGNTYILLLEAGPHYSKQNLIKE